MQQDLSLKERLDVFKKTRASSTLRGQQGKAASAVSTNVSAVESKKAFIQPDKRRSSLAAPVTVSRAKSTINNRRVLPSAALKQVGQPATLRQGYAVSKAVTDSTDQDLAVVAASTDIEVEAGSHFVLEPMDMEVGVDMEIEQRLSALRQQHRSSSLGLKLPSNVMTSEKENTHGGPMAPSAPTNLPAVQAHVAPQKSIMKRGLATKEARPLVRSLRATAVRFQPPASNLLSTEKAGAKRRGTPANKSFSLSLLEDDEGEEEGDGDAYGSYFVSMQGEGASTPRRKSRRTSKAFH